MSYYIEAQKAIDRVSFREKRTEKLIAWNEDYLDDFRRVKPEEHAAINILIHNIKELKRIREGEE